MGIARKTAWEKWHSRNFLAHIGMPVNVAHGGEQMRWESEGYGITDWECKKTSQKVRSGESGWVISPSARVLVEMIISLRWCQMPCRPADKPFAAQIPGFRWPLPVLELCKAEWGSHTANLLPSAQCEGLDERPQWTRGRVEWEFAPHWGLLHIPHAQRAAASVHFHGETAPRFTTYRN